MRSGGPARPGPLTPPIASPPEPGHNSTVVGNSCPPLVTIRTTMDGTANLENDSSGCKLGSNEATA